MIDEFWLHLARFIGGSTFLLASIYIAERTGFLKNLQWRAWLWKLATIGTLVLALPFSASILSPYQLPITVAAPAEGIAPEPVIDNTSAANANRESNFLAFDSNPITNTPTANTLKPHPVPMSSMPIVPKKNSMAIKLPELPLSMSATALFVCAWLLLVACTLLRLGLSYKRGIQSLGQRQKIAENSILHHLFRDLCRETGIKRAPSLTQSTQTRTPVTLLSNEICLPVWVDESLPTGELKSLLAHELGHVKHHDLRYLLLTQIICSLFFFQPLLLLARNRLIDISEFLADQWAVQQCKNTNDVANALLNCASNVGEQQNMHWGFAMAGRRSRLRARVEGILQTSSDLAKLSSARKLSVAIALLGLIFVFPKLEYSYAATKDTTESIEAQEPLRELQAQQQLLLKKEQQLQAQREQVDQTNREARRQLSRQQYELERQERQLRLQMEKVEELQQQLLREQEEHEAAVSTQLEQQQLDAEAALLQIEDQQLDDKHDTIVHLAQSSGFARQIRISNGRSNAQWTENGKTESISWEGEIGVDDDETMITSLANNGYFNYSSKGYDPDRAIAFKPAGDDVSIEYKVDGEVQTFTDADKTWLHEMLLRFFRRTGVQAEERVDRLLRRGGTNLVIDELFYIDSDSAHRRYTTALVQKASLNNQQFDRVMEAAGTVSSDSEMRRLLTAVMEHSAVSGRRWDSLLNATLTISSDSEMRRLLETVIATDTHLNPEQWGYFLKAAGTISSDSESRRLLEEVAKKTDALRTNAEVFLQVADSISSDSECRRLLETVANSSSVVAEQPEIFFTVANNIASDSEMRRLLGEDKLIAQLPSQHWNLYFATAKTISSDSEMGALLTHVVKSNHLDKQGWKIMLGLIHSEVSSKSERDRILRQAAAALPDDEEIQTLYSNIAHPLKANADGDGVLVL